MRKSHKILAVIIPAIAVVVVGAFGFAQVRGARANAVTCVTTDYYRDGHFLTAAVINPAGTYKGNHGVLDAGWCDIGVYYSAGHNGTVASVEIYDAVYFGVVNNGGNVNVMHARIHDIRDSAGFSGNQRGVGIYWVYESKAAGTIYGNLIWNYQKGGIVVNGHADYATIMHNTVTGQGPIDYIAQNGIQIGYGAHASVSYNSVSANSYTGAGQTDDGGIITIGGTCYGSTITPNTRVVGNTVDGNDIGIWLSEIDYNSSLGYCVPTHRATNAFVYRNTVSDDAITNTTGAITSAYQAGIAVQGTGDQLIQNVICGAGYATNATPPPYIYYIDDTFTNAVTESGNVEAASCDLSSAPTSAAATHAAGGAMPRASSKQAKLSVFK